LHCNSARNSQKKFRIKFPWLWFLHRNTMQNLVKKVIPGVLKDRKPEHTPHLLSTRACENCYTVIETMALQNRRCTLFAATWSTSQTSFLWLVFSANSWRWTWSWVNLFQVRIVLLLFVHMNPQNNEALRRRKSLSCT
jgi:hypothetical protein